MRIRSSTSVPVPRNADVAPSAPARASATKQGKPATSPSGFDVVRTVKRVVREAPAGAALLGLALLCAGTSAAPLSSEAALVHLNGTDVPHITTNAVDPLRARQAPHSTVTWPAERVFPRFVDPAPRIDVIDAAGMSADEATVLTTFQGLVNRKQPRVYLRTNDLDSSQWLRETGLPHDVTRGRFDLLVKYRDEIDGIVVPDETMPESLNVATTLASQRHSIVVPRSLVPMLTAEPYGFPVVEDLRTRGFTDPVQMYEWQLDALGDDAATRMLIGLGPWVKGSVRDYAVATGSMVVWLDPRKGNERQLLDRYMSRMPVGSTYLGWWPEERSGVEMGSRHGIATFPSDWSENLSLLTSVKAELEPKKAPPKPRLENKAYVAMFMSDGDNLQLGQGLVPRKWSDTHRGEVPIAWTTSPALAEIAPAILGYYHRTATDNDTLVSGPSGLGYTYPGAWPVGAFATYAKNTDRAMKAAGLDAITMWNNNRDLSDVNAADIVEHMPHLRGMTAQEGSKQLQFLDGRIPLMRLHISYGDTAKILTGGVDKELRRFDGSAPRFIAVQGNLNFGAMGPTAMAEVQAAFAHRPDVEFVRHDHFFDLVREAKKTSAASLGASPAPLGAVLVGALVSTLALTW